MRFQLARKSMTLNDLELL